MPILLLILVGVIVWMAVTYRRRMRVRTCIWRENRSKDTAEARYYLCVYCGAERYEPDGPPGRCYRPDDPS